MNDALEEVDYIGQIAVLKARVSKLEKKYEPTTKARIAALKRTIAHHKKEIEWKHRDDVDHAFNSVLRDMAQGQLDKLRALTSQE